MTGRRSRRPSRDSGPAGPARPARRRAAARGALIAGSVAALFATAALGSPAQAAPDPDPPQGTVRGLDSADRVPGSYLVVLDSAASLAGSPAAAADALTDEHGGRVTHVYSTALNGFALRTDERTARELAADPSVAYVEADQRVQATGTQPNPPSWGLDRVDQAELPLDDSYTYPDTSGGVTAYIIDTGIRTTHSDFGGRARWGTNTTGDGRTTDCNGHGTHVAGTTAGGDHGVAKEADLVAVKVLGCDGNGTTAGVVDGVDWVTRNASGPSVANMSLGGGNSTALDNAVKSSIAAGITYAVAAGNDSSDACSGSPNRVPEAITTGATTSSDGRSYFSNYGSCLDLFAPGSSITSAWIGSDTDTHTISGTSMASPHVAGAAVLVKGANPSWTPQQVRDHLVGLATPGVVGSPGSGSPNLLLRVPAPGDPDPENDFALSVTPDSASVTAGESAGATLGTEVTSGSAETVTLSASGLPAGTDAAFDPSSVTAGESAQVTLATSASTPNGTYQVSLTGRSASAEHSVTFTLTVTGGTEPECTPGQLLANPGFESGETGWTVTDQVIGQWSSQGQPPHAGSWNAWFNGYGRTSTDQLRQNVTLPEGCSSYELSYQLHIDSAEYTSSTAYDTFRVEILTADGSQVLDTLDTYSNLDENSGYARHTADLGTYAGQEIRLRFTGEEDVSLQTSFVLDDTAVDVS
ncbi:S8 family serine peptidase [Streptomyces sp. JJ36]|uniref:S8 family serine peptidase n=1 Tax=Streptomyces sp. JJ36 TaxID=2736645 RepID=UPI0023519781|nr:S8 family serine peptidase [Streptomyces sp. JJ36]MCF6524153.1 S8 family peptidase [Streptomyces sp. JJ36]